jgi:hypothetical protein
MVETATQLDRQVGVERLDDAADRRFVLRLAGYCAVQVNNM